MFDLEQIIMERHSTRLFLSKPVPRKLVDEALGLAVHAPSNSNIQPWRVVFASGPARDRLGGNWRISASPNSSGERMKKAAKRRA
jgi:nitroreductase